MGGGEGGMGTRLARAQPPTTTAIGAGPAAASWQLHCPPGALNQRALAFRCPWPLWRVAWRLEGSHRCASCPRTP